MWGLEGGLVGLVSIEVIQGHKMQTLSGKQSARREMRELLRKKANEAKCPW